MSRFLSHLIQRTVGPASTVAPRLPGRYESAEGTPPLQAMASASAPPDGETDSSSDALAAIPQPLGRSHQRPPVTPNRLEVAPLAPLDETDAPWPPSTPAPPSRLANLDNALDQPPTDRHLPSVGRAMPRDKLNGDRQGVVKPVMVSEPETAMARPDAQSTLSTDIDLVARTIHAARGSQLEATSATATTSVRVTRGSEAVIAMLAADTTTHNSPTPVKASQGPEMASQQSGAKAASLEDERPTKKPSRLINRERSTPKAEPMDVVMDKLDAGKAPTPPTQYPQEPARTTAQRGILEAPARSGAALSPIPAMEATPASAAPAQPSVHVTIGRIELRAAPQAAPVPAAKAPSANRPTVSLHDYLARRNKSGQR